jgi:hypothetical protein
MKVLTPSYYSRKWANKRVAHRYRESSHHVATPPPQTTSSISTPDSSPPSPLSSQSSPSPPPTLSSSPPASPPTTNDNSEPDVVRQAEDESGGALKEASWPLDAQQPVLPPGTFIGENLALRHREGYQFTLNRVQRCVPNHCSSSHAHRALSADAGELDLIPDTGTCRTSSPRICTASRASSLPARTRRDSSTTTNTWPAPMPCVRSLLVALFTHTRTHTHAHTHSHTHTHSLVTALQPSICVRPCTARAR